MRRNKHLLLWSSLGTLALLGWAAYEENVLQGWRVLQREYAEKASVETAGFGVRLRQVVVPKLDVADRCVSCHLGMAPGQREIKGSAVFAAHPAVVHDPAEFGCTTCHAGQGRATVEEDAHGRVPHWPEPMIPAHYAHAGCGACHTHLEVPNLAALERGRRLFERYDCLACHRLDGRGGTLRPGGRGGMEGPDLSTVGGAGYDEGWYRSHLEQRAKASEGAWAQAFGPIPAGEREALAVFLSSRVGAPGLVESKALFHSLGCRGCHPIGGIGGEDGPDLTRVGEKDPGQLDFSHVPGAERSLAAWFAEHFRAPAKVVPGSEMPDLGLTREQIDGLTFYMFSLRRTDVPERYWPKDRILAERFGEREFATDGATLYTTFCAACHGSEGEGMRYPGMIAFPAIGNRDFLELVSDDFLRENILQGRPGRRMPAWGESAGGLRDEEIDSIVHHLRQLGGGVEPKPDPRPKRWAEGDPARGRALYAATCASCHGDTGEGKEGPALANRVFLETAGDTYIVKTILGGRDGTEMPAFSRPSLTRRTLSNREAEAITAYIRTWEERE